MQKSGAWSTMVDWHELTDRQIRVIQRTAEANEDHERVALCRVACGDYETSTQSEIKLARIKVARIVTDIADSEEGTT